MLWRIQERKSKPNELDFWDERLLVHGQYISEKRKELFEFLNMIQSVEASMRRSKREHLGGEHGVFSWELKQSLLTEEKLSKNRERDIDAGVTLSGPHRDDFRFLFNGRDMEFFGSRGEQRMAVLAIKLAELEYIAKEKGSRPVLALDDIFSELDEEHREAVLGVIGKQQTIITAAEKDSLPKSIFKMAKLVELG